MTAPTIAPTAWQIDPAHTELEFSARHLMISNVKGHFADPTGEVTYDPAHPDVADIHVKIPVATINTRNAQRDAHLRSADFFDAEHYPEIEFTGGKIAGDVQSEFTLSGDLTMRGVTKSITLKVNAEGGGNDPWGNERLGFSATASVNRHDFGLNWNQVLETGGVVVGDVIKIIINIELMRPRA